jgi:uncharacterized protein
VSGKVNLEDGEIGLFLRLLPRNLAFRLLPLVRLVYETPSNRSKTMMRDQLAAALKDAMKSKDAPRLSTIRLIQAEIKTRDIANRSAAKGDASDDEILQILAKMVKQREESAKIYEDNARPELAAKERAEIVVVQDFMPRQLSEADVRANVAAAIAEVGASGPKDMGKVMAVLKERYAGQMDFAKGSSILKELLTAA